MLIPSTSWLPTPAGPSLSRGMNANSQQDELPTLADYKSIKRDEC